MVFLKNISDTSDGKKKQTSKTRRRPETQLGTSCHCTGRKLHRLKTRPALKKTDILQDHSIYSV